MSVEEKQPFECKFYHSSVRVNPSSSRSETNYEELGLWINRWLRRNGEWVEKGTPLFNFKNYSGRKIDTFLDFIAPVSGILQIVIEQETSKNSYFSDKAEILENGDVVCILHPVGSYKHENVPLNDPYYFFYDEYKHPFINVDLRNSNIRWHVADLSYVNLVEKVFSIETNNNGNILVRDHFAEKAGYISIIEYAKFYNSNIVIYKISESNLLALNKYKNEPEIRFDEFTKLKRLLWKRVAFCEDYLSNLENGDSIGSYSYSKGLTGISSKSIDNQDFLIFSFYNIENKDFIVFQFNKKDFRLTKGDVVSFLFDGDIIIDFIIQINSYKPEISNDEDFLENRVRISQEDLMIFKEKEFQRWKILLKRKNREIVGGEVGFANYEIHANLVMAIQKFASDYINLVHLEIDDHEPLLKNQIQTLNNEDFIEDECFVYLMVDTTNKFHKIGISNSPEWRERTLQSEKPTIELLAIKRYVSRRIATSIESALHQTFSDKRIRGEWFKLDYIEIEEIKRTLDD